MSILEFNTTDSTAEFQDAATGDPRISLAGGDVTFALVDMSSEPFLGFNNRILEVAEWTKFIETLRFAPTETARSLFSREISKKNGVNEAICLKSQVGVDTIVEIEWKKDGDTIELQSAVEITVPWTDWKQHLEFLLEFLEEVQEARNQL